MIEFTIGELYGWIIGGCSLVMALAGVISLIINGIRKAKQPNRTQDERLSKIEDRLDAHDKLFQRDLRRFENLEEVNQAILRALLALMRHGINGNDIDSLRQAEEDLQNYLTKRSSL